MTRRVVRLWPSVVSRAAPTGSHGEMRGMSPLTWFELLEPPVFWFSSCTSKNQDAIPDSRGGSGQGRPGESVFLQAGTSNSPAPGDTIPSPQSRVSTLGSSWGISQQK